MLRLPSVAVWSSSAALASALYFAALSLYAPPLRRPLAPSTIDLCETRRPGALPRLCQPDSEGGSSATDEATLLFAGDTAELDAPGPILDAQNGGDGDDGATLDHEGVDHPFAATAELIGDADLAVVNLEAPLTDGGDRFPFWKEYLYRAPTTSARALARAGFDVVGLANNHSFDYGASGLADTRAALAAAALAPVGAGADEAEARRAVIVRVGALRVGILSRCERKPGWDLHVRQYALGEHPGVAALDGRALDDDIARLRPLVDLVVVSAHWGESYAPATGAELAFARRAAAAGADLVVGHHPHVAQPLLLLGRTPVALSLGNYAFATPGKPDLSIGLLLRAHVARPPRQPGAAEKIPRPFRITRLELIPIDVQNRRVHFQPQPLDEPAARAALAPLVDESRALGAPLTLEGGHAVLDLDKRRGPAIPAISGATMPQ